MVTYEDLKGITLNDIRKIYVGANSQEHRELYKLLQEVIEIAESKSDDSR